MYMDNIRKKKQTHKRDLCKFFATCLCVFFFPLCYPCTSKFVQKLLITLSHSTPSLCLISTLSLTPRHQSLDTHPLNFQKSHYDVIQVGLFCTHAGTKKSNCILVFLFCWLMLKFSFFLSYFW